MQVILFIIYLFFFSWLITRISFFANIPINKWWLILLFLIKITAGIAYGYFYAQPQNINTSDTWNYYHASLLETEWLLRDPIGFVKDLFHNGYAESGNLFDNQDSYWNDLKSNTIIKFIALINVFTGKSYYTDVIFFNFLYFFGPAALYRLTLKYWSFHKMLLILPIFLLPSFLFWCSGIHKDGLIFSAMLLIIYSIDKQLQRHRLLFLPCLLITACFIMLFALRNFVLLLLVPALTAWILSEKRPSKKWLIYSSIYIFCFVFFFTAKYFLPALDFPGYIVAKQAEFNVLNGNSKVAIPALHPSVAGFIAFLPYAIDMSFLQPHWSNIKSFTYLAAMLENALLLLLIVAGFIFGIRIRKLHPFLLFLIFTSFSLLLLTGYTVTFAGAVVRYKSIAVPLLGTAMCCICSKRLKMNQETN